ncbi:MAG: hypothetical protein ABH967_02080 [Patescibacteria group bacterium]
MQVFEFYFNPKIRSDLIFESFCYEPENIYQKRVGSLYMVGSLNNALPQSHSFLDRLSKVIQDKYYSPSARSSSKSLKESLKRSNQFLQDLVAEGQISWLGNLNFIVFSAHKNKFNFSKVGDLKIFLLRKGKIINVEEKIKTEDIDPYPLKVFLNIVSGQLKSDDTIFILSKELAEFFEKENILAEVAELYPFDQKGLVNVLNNKKEDFEEISGVCLALLFDDQKMIGKKRTILTQPKTKDFSFKKAIAPILVIFNQFKIPKFKLPKIQTKSQPKPKKKEKIKKKAREIKEKTPIKFKIPKISFKLPKLIFPKLSLKIPDTNKLKKKLKTFIRHKNTILLFTWIVILSLGFLIFQGETRKDLEKNQSQLNQIEEKIDLADNLLTLKSIASNKQAMVLLKAGWQQILEIEKLSTSLSKNFQIEIAFIKEKLKEKLYELNKMEQPENPELFYEFKLEKFVPQKFVIQNNNFYFFSPYRQNILKIDINKNEEIIETNNNFDLASSIENSVLFFQKPNKLFLINNNEIKNTFTLEEPFSEFNFTSLSSFKSNLYFLDKKNNEIIKYTENNQKWYSHDLWINGSTQKIEQCNSIAVDGAVWVMKKDSLDKYVGGVFQINMNLNIFPDIQDASKIFADFKLPYLYILEPTKNRIIVLNKSGEIVKQFQSDKFNNLLDFGVSQDGKTVYLLNGLKIYKIDF